MGAPRKVLFGEPGEAFCRATECARVEILSGDLDHGASVGARPLVRESRDESWRNRAAADDADRIELVGEALENHRRRHPLASMMEMIRALLLPGADDKTTTILLAVGDENGRLLWVEGDRDVRSWMDDLGFAPGTNWSEDDPDSGGFGAAAALGHAVQRHGGRHRSRPGRPFSYTAAPVRDPETRRLVGVIHLAGSSGTSTPQMHRLLAATVRAVEAEMYVARLRGRGPDPVANGVVRDAHTIRGVLHVLGRDRACLETENEHGEHIIELSARHAAILLMLAVHKQGLSAERLAELVYGVDSTPDTLRPEMVRLRKALVPTASGLIPKSRPYRLPMRLDTDAHEVLSLLSRGAHRLALAAYRGPVLPSSNAPGVEDFRESIRAELRESMFSEASVDVLLAYTETPEGSSDAEILRLALEMLPARSPKRAGLVSRIERLGQE